ncbi:uncharacterized protein LOC133190647 [Saccostrea echinata]|uniref:uncharacterized protein LOC133190647 n=1 Tax=Saccostrea echinata TaxID=191078 RepID=UPI002A80C72C|nr:uncharacterized protein LOC133190647 [Saccostrea echinata]
MTENGETFIQDRKTLSKSEMPMDSQQDITLISSSREDSVTTLTLSRPLATNDPSDFSLLHNCAYFLFARGVFNSTTNIKYNDKTAFLSNEKICVPCTEVQSQESQEKDRTLSISFIIIIVTFATFSCSLFWESKFVSK